MLLLFTIEVVMSISFSDDSETYAESLLEALDNAIEHECDLEPSVVRRLIYIIRLFDRFKLTAPNTFGDRHEQVARILAALKDMLINPRSWSVGQRAWVDCVMRFIVDQHGDVIARAPDRLNPQDVLKAIG